MADLTIVVEPFDVSTQIRGVSTVFPGVTPNVNLNKTLYIRDADIEAYGTVVCSIHGSWLNVRIEADPFVLSSSILGTDQAGAVIAADPFVLKTSITHTLAYTETVKKNWIKWSNINALDFTIGKDNVAGDAALNWKGWVYANKKLGKKVVVYGENGVTFLHSSGNMWGQQDIHKVGLKGRNAVCGNEVEHFFIDKKGRMYVIGETIELLGYEEYLSYLLSSVVMSYDTENRRIYICDGIIGFVYSIKDKSLGVGPSNISGIGVQDGNIYYVSPGTITVPTFDIGTDIYDLGNRKHKTIQTIEVGTDVTVDDLYLTIDFRNDKVSAFRTLDWHKVMPDGVVVIPCYGVEFRFYLKALTYHYFELDYIKVNGVIHGYSYLDSLARLKT